MVALCNVAFSVVPDSIDIKWMVDGNLYSQSTCEYGGDVILPTNPTKRGHTFVGWRRNYVELEYLQGTGTQYIDTLFTANSYTGIKVKVQLDSINNYETVVFGGINQYSFEFFVWDQKPSFCYGGTFEYGPIVKNGDFLEINWNKNRIEYTINDSGYYYMLFNATDFADEGSLYLFELQRSSTNRAGKMKIYYFQIYDNGNLIRDFIPVLDSYGVPCMYDRVTNKFFYNQGTGQFIAGPIKS